MKNKYVLKWNPEEKGWTAVECGSKNFQISFCQWPKVTVDRSFPKAGWNLREGMKWVVRAGSQKTKEREPQAICVVHSGFEIRHNFAKWLVMEKAYVFPTLES